MEDNKNGLIVPDIKFVALDPEVSAPNFKEQRGKDWVPYETVDRVQYPDKLITLMNNSALHGAILQSKMMQVSGNGFIWDDTPDTTIDASTSVVSEEVETPTSQFMSNINDEYDANELLWKMSTDLELFGGIALEITWTKDWERIGSIRHIDFSKVRAEKVNSETGVIDGYFYCWDWTKQRTEKVYLPAYNENGAKANRKAYREAKKKLETQGVVDPLVQLADTKQSQIFYYKPYRPDSFYYPLPMYVGAISAIETDILSDQYGVSSFENGLNTDIIVTMFGINTDEQKNTEARKFLKMHTGAKKARKPIVAFAKDAESALKIDTINSSKEDKIYTSVNENTLQKILSGHRITTPEIVGIKTPGELGSGNDQELIEFWNKTVILPEQFKITKIMNKFMDINGLETVSIEPLHLSTESVNATPKDGQEPGNNTEFEN